MKIIKKYIKHINDELCGAHDYAEKYIEYKAKGDTQTAQRFLDASKQEITHATLWHDLAVKEADMINNAVKVPDAMNDRWKLAQAEYVDEMARIKQIWTM